MYDKPHIYAKLFYFLMHLKNVYKIKKIISIMFGCPIEKNDLHLICKEHLLYKAITMNEEN